MAKISPELVDEFKAQAHEWLKGRGFTREDVKLGSDAWLIACNSGITDACYGNTAKDLPGIPGCHDAHIQTALMKIFPNCKFVSNRSY